MPETLKGWGLVVTLPESRKTRIQLLSVPMPADSRNSINMNFLVRIFPRTFLTLTPGCQGVKKFLPTTGSALFGADVHEFRCGRP